LFVVGNGSLLLGAGCSKRAKWNYDICIYVVREHFQEKRWMKNTLLFWVGDYVNQRKAPGMFNPVKIVRSVSLFTWKWSESAFYLHFPRNSLICLLALSHEWADF
jgi:hypothetical protein